MAAEVSIVVGPARSGKTAELVHEYAAHLAASRPGSGLWLAPNFRAANAIRQRVFDAAGRALLSPGVTTFEHFSDAILRASRLPRRPLTRLDKRQLIRQIIDELRARGALGRHAALLDTVGMLDRAEGLISDLKRREIWPEELRKGLENIRADDERLELCLIYEAYQQRLTSSGLYDAEGRIWSARTLLRQGERKPFERVRLVLADGFTDFNRTQREIIQELAAFAERVVVTLPLDDGPDRDDLFTRPRRTLDEIGELIPNARIRRAGADLARSWPAMASLETRLFAPPGKEPPSGNGQGIEMVAAASVEGEIRWVAKDIKRLLVEGDPNTKSPVAPDDILVVFRSLTDMSELVRELFMEYGLPFALERSPPLTTAPGVRALLAVLRLVCDDWPLRGLLDVLGNSLIRPNWREWQVPGALAAARRMVRWLQWPRGRESLLDAVQAWSQLWVPVPSEALGVSDTNSPGFTPDHDDAEIMDHDSHNRQRSSDAALALPLLTRLAKVLDQLPDSATPGQWAVALRKLANDLRIEDAGPSDHSGRTRRADDVGRLYDALHGFERLYKWLAEPSPAWNPATLFRNLSGIANSETTAQATDESGRIRILAATSARALEVPYLYMAGLSELKFPTSARDDRGFSEVEIDLLASLGLPFASRADQAFDEMLLFHEVVTRATRRLVLSYPALDESAQPLSPSPFLHEVEQLFSRDSLVKHEPLDLRPTLAARPPASLAELRITAVNDALEGHSSTGLWALAVNPESSGVVTNLLAAFQGQESRSAWGVFGPYEGMIEGAAALDVLNARFGPDHAWGPSQLETFATCPFRFFAERVLSLSPMPGLHLEIDRLTRGSLLHDTLAKFHDRVRKEGLSPVSTAQEELLAVFDQAIDAALAGQALSSARGALQRILDRRLLAEWRSPYIQQWIDYAALSGDWDEPLVPTHFEVAFGAGREGEAGGAAFLAGGVANAIKITGRIDRIDIGRKDGQPVFYIVDYKSGKAQGVGKQIESGLRLQLPLYAAAVEKSFFADSETGFAGAGYWFIQGQGLERASALETFPRPGKKTASKWGTWPEERERAIATALSIAQAIRQGTFPVHSRDERCTEYCEFSTICRIHNSRVREKHWSLRDVKACTPSSNV